MPAPSPVQTVMGSVGFTDRMYNNPSEACQLPPRLDMWPHGHKCHDNRGGALEVHSTVNKVVILTQPDY